MRVLFPALLAMAAFAHAQQTLSTTYSTDINGRKQREGIFATSEGGKVTSRTELQQSVNGRLVPLESIEERLVREEDGKRVIERTVRHFSQDGRPSNPERQQVEERTNPDGSKSIVTTVYEPDLNGNYRAARRIVTEESKQGSTLNSTTVMERITLNGTFELVEKRQKVGDDSNLQETVLRPNPQGSLQEWTRTVTQVKEANGERTENTAQYEVGYDGRLVLGSQSVARVKKNPDGSESKEVDLFRRLPGRADPTATPALEERQVIEQQRSGEQLTESTYVQRPSINDPKRLSAPRKILERVCTGADCK
jgi:hypothetical protein